MDTELNERLIRRGLEPGKNLERPLQIRRTLDQAYFLNLKDTSMRDKDQVVYRATRKPFRDPGNGSVTRVVMVDQLWLWILDECKRTHFLCIVIFWSSLLTCSQDTIITAFPRRWGNNKPDSSGIHKGLRERLGDLEMMSVWHLGKPLAKLQKEIPLRRLTQSQHSKSSTNARGCFLTGLNHWI